MCHQASFLTVLIACLSTQILALKLQQQPEQSAAKDEIESLPGLKQAINFKQYSGFLNADQPAPTKNNSFLHYWFVESQSEPQKDPIVLWLNGGPGCSSLAGLFTELGPFEFAHDGELVLRNYSWNKFANLLFLDSPIYVGYSYTKLGDWLTQSDDSTARTNQLALASFYQKFPQFKRNPLYLAGESYGGVFVTTLGLLLNADKSINLRGIAIGNGYLDEQKCYMSLLLMAYHYGLYGKDKWDALSVACCNQQPPSFETCKFSADLDPCGHLMVDLITFILDSGVNPYNIYKDCARNSHKANENSDSSRLFAADSSMIQVALTPRCLDDGLLLSAYLNQKAVRAAIHVPDNLASWQPCVPLFYLKGYASQPGGLAPQLRELCDSRRNLTMLMYSGDVDLMANFMGVQWIADSLNRRLVREWIPWHVDEQVAGFVKHYEGLSFVTVKGAGHMAPQDRPAESSALIKKWLYPGKRGLPFV